MKALIDAYFDSNITFIKEKGHTWGMLRSMRPQLLAEVKKNNSVLGQFSEAGQKTAINIKSWLAEKEREPEDE